MTIETRKPFGPAPGTFSSSGAIPESGTFLNSSVIFEDVDASDFVTVHVTQRFDGALGTFTLRAAITETATEDPNVLTDHGTWAIIDGTGAYETLQGRGRVIGIADDNLDLISRTYRGTVRRG
ncbi:MAG TPA: hypothetical protein VI011_16760 [Asanoa sp.]